MLCNQQICSNVLAAVGVPGAPAAASVPAIAGVLAIANVPSFPLETPVPEFIDPVFTKTSSKRSFSLNRKRAFWLVFAKTGSIISGTGNVPAVAGSLILVRISDYDYRTDNYTDIGIMEYANSELEKL